jgi:hypothetical protein
MAWMCWIHIQAVFVYPYFSPSSNVEELAYTYISSGNFNRFGFLFTDFLQNFAASSDPSDHPYVYDHMPPGPDVANALLMRLTGGSFAWTSVIFALIVPVGFAFYLTFLKEVLWRYRIVGGGFFVLILTPWISYLPHFTNPIWNGFLILTFVPLVLLNWSNGQHRPKWFFFGALPVVLLSSLYLDYIVQCSIVAGWNVIILTQLVPIGRRQIGAFISTVALGVFLNVLKNLIYFGPTVFFQELYLVLSNRITGFPS